MNQRGLPGVRRGREDGRTPLSRNHSMRNRRKQRKQRLELGFGPHARPLPPSLFGEEKRARRNPILLLSVPLCSLCYLLFNCIVAAKAAVANRDSSRLTGCVS